MGGGQEVPTLPEMFEALGKDGWELITHVVNQDNVANGTTLYWALEGTNIDGNDFSSGALTGSGSISNNTFNFTHTLSSDATTEGTETIEVKLYVDSARTVKVAEASVTVNDTSYVPGLS